SRLYPLPLLAVLLSSCGTQSTVPTADAPTATVVMRDGTKAVGKVLESSPAQIKIETAGKATQTIPMSQVKRVEYAEAKAAPGEAAEDEHHHATSEAVTSKTSELPVGTVISVRNEETIDSGRSVEGQRFAAEVIRDVKDASGDVV